MPTKAIELSKVAQKLGFEKARQKGSHARWEHPDGRATTIPVHDKVEMVYWQGYLRWSSISASAHHRF
jgi:predicted RNA binding protein YcfA (HicA-like mRNA interferase family)